MEKIRWTDRVKNEMQNEKALHKSREKEHPTYNTTKEG